MKKVFLASSCRTPIGSFLGSLASVTATSLGSTVISNALYRAKIESSHVDEVIMGMVLPAGTGQAPARQAALGAGLPQRTPCTTMNKVCGSGLKAVMMAASAIKAGDAHCVVAGGMESMSNVPFALPNMRGGQKLGNASAVDLLVNDGLWDVYNNFHMGSAAELCAKECNISREDQDKFAITSYKRSQAAITSGAFKNEITPVAIKSRKDDILVEQDEEPLRFIEEKFTSLRPAFEKEGTITAGNASTINDGASAVSVVSEEFAKTQSLSPVAEILGYTTYAGAPEWFSTAPQFAISALLEAHNLKTTDIDLYEINEAFSVVAIANMQKLNISADKVNVNGGAISLGHPIGASGARILTTLIHALHAKDKELGVASLCIGGGEAVAVLVKRC